METPTLKSFAFGVAAAALGGLAILVTAEFVLRFAGLGVIGAQGALHELRLDRPWLFGLRPGFRGTLDLTGDVLYEINSDGFRDRSYPKQVPVGRFRILVLGASVSFGWGVSEGEIYPTRLEAILRGRHGERVEVLNFGVNGYNAYNQSALLADRGLAYEPDLVLVEFGVAAIMDPAFVFDSQTRLHPGLIPEQALPHPAMRREPPPFAGLLRACRRLRTCSFVSDAFREKPDPRAALVAFRPRELPPGPERHWLRQRYGEMARAAAAIGARFAVVAFPYQAQVYDGASGRLQEQLVELGREAGWPTLNLLPAFRSAADAGSEPLLLDGWHPTAVGHAVAAKVIADWLVREELLAKDPLR